MWQTFYAPVWCGQFLRSAEVCITKIYLTVADDSFQKVEFELCGLVNSYPNESWQACCPVTIKPAGQVSEGICISDLFF